MFIVCFTNSAICGTDFIDENFTDQMAAAESNDFENSEFARECDVNTVQSDSGASFVTLERSESMVIDEQTNKFFLNLLKV